MVKGSDPGGIDNKGVSPVIAVILMVAITVVLSGVVFLWASSFSSQAGNAIDLSRMEISIKDDPAGDRLVISIISGDVIWGSMSILMTLPDGSVIRADLSSAPQRSSAGDKEEFDSFLDGSGSPCVFDGSRGDHIEVRIVNIEINSLILIRNVIVS